MLFRIEYAGNQFCRIVHSRDELIGHLQSLKQETVLDIRKIYKSGVSDSVLEKYLQYIPERRGSRVNPGKKMAAATAIAATAGVTGTLQKSQK